MDIKSIIMSKNGLAVLTLAKEFLNYEIGSRIPTISQFCEQLDFSRGTIQNSIKLFVDNHVIQLDAKGHMGTYLISKDIPLLLKFANIDTIVGTMPLPYSKKYEGLASGLVLALENKYDILTSMAYMRGAKSRMSMLMTNRYDFAIVSMHAALEYQKKYNNVDIVINFGLNTYLSEHVIIFHNEAQKTIQDHMKIGVDFDSIDHRLLTEKVCQNKQVEFVPMEYSRILTSVMNGSIDAAVWNLDEISDKGIQVPYVAMEQEDAIYSQAVLVVSRNRPEIASLLKEIVDVDTVLNIQKLVLDGKIAPSY
ncbi:MAG: GntR family transcriptional regulator YhfZ [Erysipelotrichaceae bacterium]|nr:GntR family transcriptional regulator YhfZ [Erysipelotrichaceae bacterium]MDO5085469.1 GntR family transcriptional regulator YhfZ [Erysipelotrichaceae bacterium]